MNFGVVIPIEWEGMTTVLYMDVTIDGVNILSLVLRKLRVTEFPKQPHSK